VFGFLSLVDLLNGICTFKGSSSLDADTLLGEHVGDPVGELTAKLVELAREEVAEPAGELPHEFSCELVGAPAGVESNAGSSTNVPCFTCFSPQF